VRFVERLHVQPGQRRDVTFVQLSEMKCHVAARRYGCLRPRFSHGGSRRIAAAGCKPG